MIYLAETQICLPLFDPHGELARLKTQVEVYPPLLKEKTAARCLWMAEFSLLHIAGYTAAGNLYAAVGTLARTASFIVQALFALNETYFLSDKAAMGDMAGFALIPPRCAERLAEILGHAGQTAAELQASAAAMHALWAEVAALTGGTYQPQFQM